MSEAGQDVTELVEASDPAAGGDVTGADVAGVVESGVVESGVVESGVVESGAFAADAEEQPVGVEGNAAADADDDAAADDDAEAEGAEAEGDDAEGDDAEGDDADDDDEDGAGEVTDGRASGRSRGSRSRSRVALLEREGEAAADFLERLLDIADLDGDIEVDIDGDRAAVSIVDSEEGRVPRRLVGPDGKVLDALQELTRLAVQTATGERSRLMLDVAGFRADRRTALVTLAQEAIAEVRSSGVARALDNMTAFERKVVHDEVTAAGLVSESEGVEPHRHIVISPA